MWSKLFWIVYENIDPVLNVKKQGIKMRTVMNCFMLITVILVINELQLITIA